MNQRRSKIIGLLIFLMIISALLFTALTPDKKQEVKKIKSINLTGNYLLPQNSYLNFAKLNEHQNLSEITVLVLKDRLEKHPYVSSAEVELSEFGDAKAELSEKNLLAILIIDDQAFVLSDELQLLPLFSNTKFVDLPIINNPKHGKQYKVLDYLRNEEIVEAYNILYTMKNNSEGMFKSLSEINLNKGNGVTLTFSGIHPIVKIGQNEIPKKVLILDKIWSDIKKADTELSQSNYVDLRFANQIYFGKAEEKKSEL